MSPRKTAPVIPVLGSTGGDSSREDELRRWEEEQARLRAQHAAPPQPEPVAQVPAPAQTTEAPAAPVAQLAIPESGQSPVVARVTAAGYLPMPEFTEPDSDDPLERLEFYSRGIMAVQYAARANHERAEQQRLIGLGLRLQAMKDEELHLEAGFNTFGDLTESRFGIKKHQANNIIRVLGVAQALEDVTTQELKERPLRVLVPILATHGGDAVRDTWQEAARHGNVTDTALKDAANFLGFGTPVDATPGPVEKKPKPPARPSQSLQAVERIRSLAAQDPSRARREAEELESAVRELLEELAGNV